jgi:hypothetical protein
LSVRSERVSGSLRRSSSSRSYEGEKGEEAEIRPEGVGKAVER